MLEIMPTTAQEWVAITPHRTEPQNVAALKCSTENRPFHKRNKMLEADAEVSGNMMYNNPLMV